MTEKIFLKEFNEYVSIRFQSPKKPFCLIVFTHGAGNDINSDFMVLNQKFLLEQNIASFCFNFVYKEKGKKLSGSKKALDIEYKAVWRYVNEKYPDIRKFAGGKSMGGRVSSRVVNELTGVLGLVFFGFPIHAPGKPDKLPADYIYQITHPMLFLQGTRDNFSKKETAEEFIPKLKKAELYWLEDGDHSWKPRKSSGKKQEELIENASKLIQEFCKQNIKFR
ncbi:MAG: alpha/beta hydrolase family protein [Candidatus Hodarchaeales archaeon]|jgi:predicted alpha/beta-hydrolase family hydrolase